MLTATASVPDETAAREDWRQLVAAYQRCDRSQAVWQVVTSFGGFVVMLVAMYHSLSVGYWLTLLLAFPAAGFVLRIFIIQHDCGHGSFWESRRANELTGLTCSLFTTVAFRYWRRRHAVHHATHGILEKRGLANHPCLAWMAHPGHACGEERATGDVWTMTVDEYLRSSWWTRVRYRICRHPLYLFGVEPVVNFLVAEHLPLASSPAWRRGERRSVWLTDLGLVAAYATCCWAWGVGTVVAIILPIALIAGAAAVWLFYVQHQFVDAYWEDEATWSFTEAALRGSSYYKLPEVLRWFTGNVGFHHIHHLSPSVPNYHLKACHESHPLFQHVTTLTIRDSLKTTRLTLWDPEQRRMVGFREALRHADDLGPGRGPIGPPARA